MAKGSRGLDELFDRVFDGEAMKNAIGSLHQEFSRDDNENQEREPQITGNPADLNEIQTVRRSFIPSDGQSDGQSNIHTVVHPVKPSKLQTVGQSFIPSDGQTVSQTVVQTVGQTVPHNISKFSDPVYTLTKNHCLVLLFLIQQGGITQRQAISDATSIPFGTVKDALKALQTRGFISKPSYYVVNNFRGISCILNPTLCNKFLELRWSEFSSDPQPPAPPPSHPVGQTVLQTVVQTDGRSDGCSPYSSSSLRSNSTTTDLEDFLNSDPELSYWRDKGLKCQQILKWMEETNMSQLVMIQSLKYCRFEMVDKDLEENKPIENVFNWFYKIIKRTGHYPKPSGYKSWAEKMAELEQAMLDEQEADNRRLEELRTRKYKLEADRKFQEMMNDPQSKTYQMVYASLSKFEKELGDGMAFEKAMRTRFDEHFASSGK